MNTRMLMLLLMTMLFFGNAQAESPRPLIVPKLEHGKAMQQKPTATAYEEESGQPDLLIGPVWLAKDKEGLRCNSSQTTCGDRPAWPMEIRAEVSNRGTGPSQAVKAQVRVTPGKNYTIEIPPLYPGTQFVITQEHDFRQLGSTEVRVEIDPEQRLQAYGGYHDLSNILHMVIRPAKPDLVISSFSADNRYVLQTTKFSFTITNTGPVYCDYPFKLKAEFVDSRAGTKMFDIPALGPGMSHTITTSHKYRSKGKKQISLLVDPESKISEIDEKNNVQLMEFRIVYP